MTSPAKFLSSKTGVQGARLPDPPEEPRMIQNRYLHHTGVSATLAHYFSAFDEGSTTLVEGAGYLCRNATDLPNGPSPDLLIAFGVASASEIRNSNGYVISQAGKPPDFVLEVASESTRDADAGAKRETFAGLGVLEYWRYDPNPDTRHPALAGERLDGGQYKPVEIFTEPSGEIWGRSEALELSLCWISRELRFWNPASGDYLRNLRESEDYIARLQAELAQLKSSSHEA